MGAHASVGRTGVRAGTPRGWKVVVLAVVGAGTAARVVAAVIVVGVAEVDVVVVAVVGLAVVNVVVVVLAVVV